MPRSVTVLYKVFRKTLLKSQSEQDLEEVRECAVSYVRKVSSRKREPETPRP